MQPEQRRTKSVLVRSLKRTIRWLFVLVIIFCLASLVAWAAAPSILAPTTFIPPTNHATAATNLANKLLDPETLRSNKVTISESEVSSLVNTWLQNQSEQSSPEMINIQTIRVELEPGIAIVRGIMKTPTSLESWVRTPEIGFDFIVEPYIQRGLLYMPITEARIGSLPIPATMLLSLIEGRVQLPDNLFIEKATPVYDFQNFLTLSTPLGTIQILPIHLLVEREQVHVQWLSQFLAL